MQPHLSQQQHHQHMPSVCLSSGDAASTSVENHNYNHHHHHSHHGHSQTDDDVGGGGGGNLSNGCDITFINVDQLNMEQLKTECILNEDLNSIIRQQQQFHHHQHLPTSTSSANHHLLGTHHHHHRSSNTPNNDLNDALDAPNDEYQPIGSVDEPSSNDHHHQHQQLHQHSQHITNNAFQYHHQCPSSMMDFNPFGWLIDRQITPPPSLANTSLVNIEQTTPSTRHPGGVLGRVEMAEDQDKDVSNHF